MAIGDIQHSQLPDNLLHEPKGASTAAAGTTYLADGNGSGAFGKVPVSSLDIAVPSVDDITPSSIDDTVSLNTSALSQQAAGALTDVQAFVGIPQEITQKINQNASELARLYQNLATINTQTKTAITNITTKLNEVITALQTMGLFDE